MSRRITGICGHEWEVPDESSGELTSSADCPVCSSLGKTSGAIPPLPWDGGTQIRQREAMPATSLHMGPAPEPEVEIPRVPGYEILGELGKGGMGVVYKARQLGLDRLVALKMIRQRRTDPALEVARFHAEARAVARLRHANIAQIFEIGEHGGAPFFSLEFVEGGTLARRLRESPLPQDEAGRLVQTLARAIEVAHRNGIIHRDLKPSNVLLTSDGTPKICDFGLAKNLDADEDLTSSGQILGTPSYMAPEQATGKVRELGPAVDVYALGAILYEMLTGRPPFRGVSVLDTLDQVRHNEPAPPSQLQPRVQRSLEMICLKCLSKDPARRYPGAQVLADELDRFLSGHPLVHTRAVGPGERLWKFCRRNPVVSSLAAGLLLSLSAGLAGVSWQWREAVAQKRRAEAAEIQALARAEAALRAQKDTARALNYLAASGVSETYSALGDGSAPAMKRIGKRPEAIRAFAQACGFAEQLRHDSDNIYLDSALAKSYAQLAVLQAAAGQRAEAIRGGRRGVELLQGGSTEAGQTQAERIDLGQTAFVLGAVLMNLQQLDQAAVSFQQSVSHFRTALAEQPGNKVLRKALSRSYFHLAHVQREGNQVEESRATSLQRLKLWVDDPAEVDEVYDVACELARCAVKSKDNKSASSHADRAVSILGQAIQMGLKDVRAVKADRDLNVLHIRADFQALLQEMEKRERMR